MRKHSHRLWLAVFIAAWLVPGISWADGAAEPWGTQLQPAGTGIGTRISAFYSILQTIDIAVVLLVLGLLIYVMLRFNRKRHPVPGGPSHNLKLEVVWTLVPCLIVAGIAAISFPLLYDMDRMPPPDLTLKVTSHQWYWSYDYPDRGDVSFDSMALWDVSEPTDDQVAAPLKEASDHWLIHNKPVRMLEVDNRVVLPVGKVVRVQITGTDVLHSWYLPSLGINRMAVTGRLNEVWLNIDKPGVYYGQCSMICGQGHGFMPIVVEAVLPEQFEAWATHKLALARKPPTLATLP
jgi:cytochrome c oxidase subunit 2